MYNHTWPDHGSLIAKKDSFRTTINEVKSFQKFHTQTIL